MAMKVVRQARLELSGGSTPDQLSPPPTMEFYPKITNGVHFCIFLWLYSVGKLSLTTFPVPRRAWR